MSYPNDAHAMLYKQIATQLGKNSALVPRRRRQESWWNKATFEAKLKRIAEAKPKDEREPKK